MVLATDHHQLRIEIQYIFVCIKKVIKVRPKKKYYLFETSKFYIILPQVHITLIHEALHIHTCTTSPTFLDPSTPLHRIARKSVK